MASDPFGLPVDLLTALTGVHPRTARRWKRHKRIPRAYRALIELRTSGELGALAADWDGFRLVNGRIWTPENTSVTPGDIRAIPYRTQLLSELQRQLAEPHQWKLL